MEQLTKKSGGISPKIRREMPLGNQQELTRRLREAERAMNIAAVLAAPDGTLDQRLNLCLALVLQQFEAERGSIMLIDRETRELVVRASIPGRVLGYRQPLAGNSIAARVVQQGEIFNCEATAKCGLASLITHKDYKKEAFIVYPIACKGGVLGVFNITDKKTGVFTGEDEEALGRFIDRIAATIENAELHERLMLNEQRLNEAKESYHRLVELAPDPIVIHADGTILYANDACVRIVGGTKEDIAANKHLRDYLHPDSLPKLRERLRLQTTEAESLPPVEYQMFGAAGALLTIEVMSSRVVYNGQKAYQAIFRDISRRKAEEAELRRAKEEAEQATALKDSFVSLVSHDLKTPVALILTMLQVARKNADGVLEEQDRLMLNRAQENAEAMQNIIERLLDINLLQTGKLTARKRFFDLAALVHEAVAVAAPLAAVKEVTISVAIPTGRHIYADHELIWQVMENLLSNALKFSRPGGTVTVDAPKDRQYTFAVADNGVGIKQEMIPMLFRPDVKTTTLGTGGEKGTGLGLPFCHEAITAHDGTITVESETNKGTTFRVALPDTRPTMLVVDANDEDRALIRKFLGHLEAHVIEAEGEGEALRKAAADKPHLIAAGIHFENKNGTTLLESLRDTPATRLIPVIAMTTDASMENRERAFSLGAKDVLAKPPREQDFIHRIKRLIYC
ncbi:MAG: PAS domain S-box protein [Nitrospinae bacterium]|nr:PAS domain S-box protein [Nitrospinota bacterium]